MVEPPHQPASTTVSAVETQILESIRQGMTEDEVQKTGASHMSLPFGFRVQVVAYRYPEIEDKVVEVIYDFSDELSYRVRSRSLRGLAKGDRFIPLNTE